MATLHKLPFWQSNELLRIFIFLELAETVPLQGNGSFVIGLKWYFIENADTNRPVLLQKFNDLEPWVMG